MNKCIMCGRLVRDPEVRYGEENKTIARFTIAVDRKFKTEGQPDADFFNCICFDKKAEFAEKYLIKGTKVIVVGRIQNDNFTNKEGQKVYSVQIFVEEVEFAEGKKAAEEKPKNEKPKNDFMSLPEGMEESLPFC